MNVLRDAATIGIAAWAMTLIIISGEIDVSVGPMVAFISVCLAFLLQFQVPLSLACLMVLILGAALGTLAGVLRGVFSVPSFSHIRFVERLTRYGTVYDQRASGTD